MSRFSDQAVESSLGPWFFVMLADMPLLGSRTAFHNVSATWVSGVDPDVAEALGACPLCSDVDAESLESPIPVYIDNKTRHNKKVTKRTLASCWVGNPHGVPALVMHRTLAEALSLLLEAQRPSRAWSRAGFTADEVRCILEEGRMVVQRFARKEVVIQGGEPATYFGVVLQGTLAIVLDRQPVLKVAGDILGEMAYFLGGVRGADIVAASEGFVATMTYRQLEAFKAHPSQGARALAERLTDTLARCTLETQAAIEQGVAVEEVVLDDADVGRRLIALQKQQRSQNWTTRDHERSAPAEALYRRAHHGSTPQAPAAAPRAARIAPSGEDDGTGGDGGLLQGHLQLCKLLRVGQAGGEWEKRWCVLAGCHVHVYAQPQQQLPSQPRPLQ